MNAITEARYKLGMAYLNDEQYREAISELKAVIELDANFIDAHCGLSRAYLELNELSQAEKSALAAISLDSNNPDALSQIDSIKKAYYDNGISSLNDTHYNDAIKSFEKVETLDPDFRNIGYNLGRAYIGLKEYDKAISSLQNSLSNETELDDIYFHLGYAYVEQRQFDNAVQHLEEAIISDPNNIDAHYNLARAYREIGNLEAATNAASETLRLDPNFQPIHDLVETIKQTHYNKGIVLLNDQHYSDAVAAFHNVIALDSDFTAAHFNLGLAYLKIENYPRAIDSLQKTVKLDPTHKSAFHALALAFFGHHELENARNAAKEALKIDPTFQPALSLLEAIDPSFTNTQIQTTTDIDEISQTTENNDTNNQQVEKENKAETTVDTSIQTEVDKNTDNSTDVEKDLIRGSVFLKNKQYNQASAAFKHVIKADPNSVEAFYGLGQVYLEIAAYDDAETAANDALKINPKHHPSRELLQVIKHVRNYERNKKIRKKVFIYISYASIIIIIALSIFAAIQFNLIPFFDNNSPHNNDNGENSNVNSNENKTGTQLPKSTPPKLSIKPSLEDPSGNGFIDAGETAQLKLIISNSGGDVKNVTIRITPSSIQGLRLDIPRNRFEVKKNNLKPLEIQIHADQNVKAMRKMLAIQLIDGNNELIKSDFEIKTQPASDKLKPQIVR